MEVTWKKENVVYDKSYQLAIQVVKVYKYLINKNEYHMGKQLLLSGTSIDANISEANGAISRADSSNKISRACKESRKTK